VIDPKDWPDDGAPEEVLEDEDEYVPAYEFRSEER